MLLGYFENSTSWRFLVPLGNRSIIFFHIQILYVITDTCNKIDRQNLFTWEITKQLQIFSSKTDYTWMGCSTKNEWDPIRETTKRHTLYSPNDTYVPLPALEGTLKCLISDKIPYLLPFLFVIIIGGHQSALIYDDLYMSTCIP